MNSELTVWLMCFSISGVITYCIWWLVGAMVGELKPPCPRFRMPIPKKMRYYFLVCENASLSGLKWQIRRLTREHTKEGCGCGDEIGSLFVQYFCGKCESELTPGPSGGGTNQVCESCRDNYGCLDGGLER